MNGSERPALNLELTPSNVPSALAFHGARWGLLVALALLTYLLFPVASGFDAPVLEVGDVASEPVIAPFGFEVRKSSAEIEREADAVAATVLPIFEYRGDVLDSVLAQTDSLFATLGRARNASGMASLAQTFGVSLTGEQAEYLRSRRRRQTFYRAVRRAFETRLARGVATTAAIRAEPARNIAVRQNGSERVTAREVTPTLQTFLEERYTGHPDPNSSVGDQVFVKLLNALVQPTLVPNVAETERRRADLRASVDSVKDVVKRNERIIDANEIVTPEVSARLIALRNEQLSRRGSREGDLPGTTGQILTNALVLAAFWMLLMLYRPQTYADLRHMLVLSVLFGLVIVGAYVTRAFIAGPLELIPIQSAALIPVPFAAMLITILFSGRVAMVAAIVLAVLIGSQAVYGGMDALFVALVGGVAAAMSVRAVRRRNHLLAALVPVSGAYLLAGVTVGLRVELSLAEVGLSGVWGGVTAFISASLVLMLLTVFESMAQVTTDLTLLELADPSRPLLRRLATEAPGTYAHSITMANLCEPACNAVAANGLLARVGCYYHDVGKLKKPQYFVENQVPGVNPHDKLKPDVSAGIIRNHVREGLVLADEHKLPEPVKAFIPEHHGTMEIVYFLDRAQQRTSDPDIDPNEYRYPGPRPRSVETAVTMLADGVEAALRVLDDPTPDKLRDAVDHIVRQRIEAGQLDDAPLTFTQLTRIKEELTRVITGVYHNRIDYPAARGGIGAEWEAASKA